jgi:short-subunit dehydrogenase
MLRQQFETNVFGLVELTHHVLPWMRQQGEGRIVNISSVVGFVSFPFRGAYNASKYAVEALSDALRVELRDTPIKVSLVEPGPIVTKFGENVVKDNLISQIEKSANKEKYQRMMINRANPRKEFSIFSFSLPPEAVANKILHALTSDKPKRRYYVTFPTYLFAAIKRCCPAAVIDWMMWKILRNETK